MNTKLLCRSCIVMVALVATGIVYGNVLPYFSIRSQGFNAARELVGWQTLINKPNMDSCYGAFYIMPEYTQTFRPQNIAQALFGDAIDCGCGDKQAPSIHIQGTKVANRDRTSLMAENFYLPTDFDSTVTLDPRIENFLVDFALYLGLDDWARGLYFRIHTPICHTRWHVKVCERINDQGANNYDPGYFNGNVTVTVPGSVEQYGIPRSQLLNSFENYISDCMTINNVAGIQCESLNHAIISHCGQTETRPAELTAAFGWNMVSCDHVVFGLNIRAAAPTGNRPKGIYLFEPIVGQGHHWELGGGLNLRWDMWQSDDECDAFGFYLDANVTHLFKAHQCRTFDLVGKPLSRYMLAMKFSHDVENLVGGPANQFDAPDEQFTGQYMPVANLTTIPVDVSAAVQGDAALKFAFSHGNFQWDLGYEFWGRSCEKICPRGNCCTNGNFSENTWALKGDAFMFGFQSSSNVQANNPVLVNPGVALSATESNATIFSGTNGYPAGIGGNAWNTNGGIDYPVPAWQSNATGGIIAPLYTNETGQALTLATDRVNTSSDPVFIQAADFDFSSASASGISNKIFTNIGYNWEDCEDWIPFLGIGAEVEFGYRSNRNLSGSSCCNNGSASVDVIDQTTNTVLIRCCNDKSTCCSGYAISQWGVWLKGGVAFN